VDILVVIKKGLKKVEKCGSRYGVKGTMKVRWKILPGGKPVNVNVLDSKYANKPVAKCVEAQIRSWRFPAISGTKSEPVTIPFKLRG
jgi:outer membrane biosynthesis protein TonB